MGRPKGSKNKPKVEIGADYSPPTEVPNHIMKERAENFLEVAKDVISEGNHIDNFFEKHASDRGTELGVSRLVLDGTNYCKDLESSQVEGHWVAGRPGRAQKADAAGWVPARINPKTKQLDSAAPVMDPVGGMRLYVRPRRVGETRQAHKEELLRHNVASQGRENVERLADALGVKKNVVQDYVEKATGGEVGGSRWV